jgi:hypothetical protein
MRLGHEGIGGSASGQVAFGSNGCGLSCRYVRGARQLFFFFLLLIAAIAQKGIGRATSARGRRETEGHSNLFLTDLDVCLNNFRGTNFFFLTFLFSTFLGVSQ